MNQECSDSLIVRARMNFSCGRYAEARRNYEEALRLDPDDLGAQAELINLLHMSGRAQEAFAAAGAMIKMNPDRHEGYLCHGFLSFCEGEYDQASESMRRAVELAPEPTEKSIAEMFQFLFEQRYEEMLMRVQELRSRGIVHPSLLLLPAMAKIAWKRDQSAMTDINEFIAKYPDLESGYQMRGIIKTGLEDWQGAEQDFTMALNSIGTRINNKTTLLLQRGICRVSLRDHLGAIDDLSAVLKSDEYNAVALYYRANAYLTMEQAEDAMRDIAKAIDDCDYRNSESLTLRGQLYHAMEKHQLALRDLTEALTLNPHHGVAHALLGFVYLGQEKYEEGVKEIELGYALEPKHALTQMVYSLIEVSRGNSVKARLNLQKAKDLGAGEEVMKDLISDLHAIDSHGGMLAEERGENIFRKKGDAWEIRFRGGDILIAKDLRGMKYIAIALEVPNMGIPCELFTTSITETISKEEVMSLDLRFDTGYSNYTWEDYSEADRKRLGQLEDRKKKALAEKTPKGKMVANDCKKEIKKIMNRIRNNSRKDVGENKKKQSQAVSKAMKEAIGHLYKIDKSLARYLDNSIKTGAIICYNSQDDIVWTLR